MTRNTWQRLRQPGRVMILRLLAYVLAAASLLFLAINAQKLIVDYQDAGSLARLWEVEWRSGESFTELVGSGFFQLFVLILGWSLFLRLRHREVAHIRLRRSEQKYRTIINHAGEAIFLLDRAGLVLEWNKAAELLFDLPRRTALNRRLPDLDLDLDVDLERVFEDVRQTHRSLSYEVKVGPGSGQPTVLSLTVSAIDPGAGFLAEKAESFVVIARDITSEKQLETRMGET
jgi:PAS domain S-box-containing protein